MTLLDDAAKLRLVEQFRASLDQFDDEAAQDAVDLHALLTEMAVLKNEVRLQARQFKAALEELQRMGEALREQQQLAQRELERCRAQVADAKAQAEHGLLLELLGLRDRLQAAVDAASAWRPSLLARALGAERRFAQSLREGSALTLQRIDELLASHRVRAIVAIGQPLDPHRMHAVAVEPSPGVAAGVVVREVRRGFTQGGELLRAAEVIVNAKAGSS
jgi:molecular chaperone GrpE